ncbi:hypothetical protein ACFSJ3_03045 [Corallincola platygyrae]|uniref:YkuD domain-containing protein n=1 Tax=Corallincola platygyrae TaxID=1193278 RepID=A0ABW4XIS7_9GAMM
MEKHNKIARQCDISDRLARIEEEIEKLTFYKFYQASDYKRESIDEISSYDATATRYIKSTSEGWVTVLINGVRTSLPSGLQVTLGATSGGRDYGVILEGTLSGKKFDVIAGYLDVSYSRGNSLQAKVVKNQAGAVTVDGISYDRELHLSYKTNGTSKKAGPFLVKTDSANPIPKGKHAIELPDYPHYLGARYGAFGTVWFRIGNTGDRYIHPGRESEGCLTCAPSSWADIYQIMHICRASGKTDVGVLDFT